MGGRRKEGTGETGIVPAAVLFGCTLIGVH